MNDSKELDEQVDEGLDSHLEQSCSLKEMDENKENSSTSIDRNKEDTDENKSKTSKKRDENLYLSLKQLFNFPLLKQNAVVWIECTNFYICNLCKCSILGIDEAYIHIAQDFHKQNLNINAKKYTRIYSHLDVLKKHNQCFWCTECKKIIELDSKLIQCHCLYHLYDNLPKSYQDILEYTVIDEKRYLKCTLCNIVLDDDKMLAEHLETPKHMQISDLLYHVNDKVYWDDVNTDNIVNSHRVRPFIFHPTKHLQIKNVVGVLNESTKSSNNGYVQKTVNSTNEFPGIIPKISKDLISLLDFFICLTCNKSFGSSKLMHQHCKAIKHKKALNNIRLVMNDSVDNFIRPLDYTKFFLRLSEHGIFTSKPIVVPKQGRPDKKTRNIAYQEDVKSFGDQYISMCIENENRNPSSIYKLDNDEIHLLQLGISLTFTFNSHRVCIPCGYKFSLPIEFAFEHLQHEVHLQTLNEMRKNEDKFNMIKLAKSCIGLGSESEDYLKCYACEIVIIKNDLIIEDHLKNSIHISKLKLLNDKKYIFDRIWKDILNETWYYAERFHCNACNVGYEREISFAGHLNHVNHLEKVKNDNASTEYKINICFACSTCWYGKPCHSEHYKTNGHERSVNAFHLFVKDPVRKLVRFFDKTMNSIMKESSTLDHNKDFLLLQSIQETVKSVYPEVKAYSFGSRFARLGSSSSDIDVFLDCENNYCKIGCQEKSKVYIKQIVKRCLQKDRNNWKIDKVLLKTRVPIVKLEHRPTRLKCDISFLNGLGVEKSKLIRNYVMADPICQQFLLFLKTWFQACKLYGSQGINGYAVTWFAIFYLQTTGHLPSVYELIRRKNESITIDGWECAYANVNISSNHAFPKGSSMTLPNLIRGFFTYYAKFKFREEVACPYLGKIMKKKDFVLIDNLPPEMGIYKERVKTIETEHFRYDSPLAIQDPVDLSQNITKAVTKTQLRQFRYSCFVSSKEIGPRR